jgi:carboxypeptidase family protein
MRRLGALFVVVGAGIFLVPALAAAQASISGIVKDASGAVLPGVTVEAASPAMIEKVRTVVTDGAGIYTIVDLRPGTYTVTFTLPGFSTVKREGIELSGAFNAEVNTDLRVGALSETITVSGASPVVDVKNTLSQAVLTKEQIEALPGGRTVKGRAALIPGVIVPGANTGVVSHGSDSNDSNVHTDGFKSGQHLVGRGTGGLGVGWGTQTQEAAIEELVYDTGGQGAEFASSGVRMNMIPKEGSNRFVAEGIIYASNKHFESNNITPELAATGLKYAYNLYSYDFNPVAGGPIKKDKLWYRVLFGE